MTCGFFLGPRRYVKDGQWIRDTGFWLENDNALTHSDQVTRQQIKPCIIYPVVSWCSGPVVPWSPFRVRGFNMSSSGFLGFRWV